MNEIERSAHGVDSELLRTFVVVAEQQSVTRAGLRLGRTQSAISVQIRRLEEALCVKLFDRHAHGVSLNDAGRLLLPAASKVLGELDRIAGLFSTPLAGRVSIGIPDDYGSELLEEILAKFAARHSHVEVSIRCGISTQFPGAIERGDLDLAVYAVEASKPTGVVIFAERTVWVAREDWVAPEGGIAPAEGVVREYGTSSAPVPIALFDQACWWRDAAIAALARAGVNYRVVVSSESVSGIKAAVRTGLAVATLAETAVEPGMRILDERDGFPDLPASSLVLIRNPRSASAPVDEMERVIREGFQRI